VAHHNAQLGAVGRYGNGVYSQHIKPACQK
jgi:hypothetical protein